MSVASFSLYQPVYGGDVAQFYYTPTDLQPKLRLGNSLTLTYQAAPAGGAGADTLSQAPTAVQIDLAPATVDPVEMAQFVIAGERYFVRNGVLVKNVSPSTGAGAPAGTFNPATGIATINVLPPSNPASITVEGLVTAYAPAPTSYVVGRVSAAPLKPGVTQLLATTVDGRQLTTVENSGLLTATEIDGKIDIQSGIYTLKFGRKVIWASLTQEEKGQAWADPGLIDGEGKVWKPTAVMPSSVRLTTVGISYVPVSKEILGLDAVRLPIDGKVQIFRRNDMVAIHHSQTQTMTPVQGQQVFLNRQRLARVRVYDALGVRVPSDRYSLDPDSGALMWANPLYIQGYATPFTVENIIEDKGQILDVDIGNTLKLNLTLSHDFPAGAKVSSALLATQDMQARTSVPFSQYTWSGVWSDSLIGQGTVWQYDYVGYPIEVSNAHAEQERWRIEFTSSISFKLIGERLGQIATGSVNGDFFPINPFTGGPYFTIRAAGWGGGQATGNLLRFNTYAATYPVDLIQCIQPGPGSGNPKQFRVFILGDKDRP